MKKRDAAKATYFCVVEGMIHGAHRQVNDELQLSEREAKYLVMAGLVSKNRKPGNVDRILAIEPGPVDLDMKTRKG